MVPGNRNDPRLLRQQPGERDLRGRRLLPRCDIAEQIDQRLVAFRASGVKRGTMLRKSVLSNVVFASIFAGQEAFAERAEGNEADPEFLAAGRTSCSGSRHHSEYSLWSGGHRLDSMSAADRLARPLRTGRNA